MEEELWFGIVMNKIVVGVEDPKYRGVFGFSGEYKGFGLSMSCRFLGGGQMINRH